MRKASYITAALLGLLMTCLVTLGGCAGSATNSKPITVHQRIELACTGYATALTVLTVANNNHKLTADQVVQIDKARHVATPVCTPASGDYPYTMSEAALQGIEAATGLVKTWSKQP